MSATFPEAVERAEWFTRYALDSLPTDRKLDPRAVSHLIAARHHLQEAVRWISPENDQVVHAREKKET